MQEKRCVVNYILGENRNQLQMIAIAQLVETGSWARIIDLFVDTMPIEDFGFTHSELQKEGRPPYHPSTMFKLYLYGYKHSIRSSRKLEHSCKVNIELWWLLRGQTPSFRTIAYFRKENSDVFQKVFRTFVLMLKDLDLIERETIGIDSFKILAQNSLRNKYTQKRIGRQLSYIDSRIKEFESAIDNADELERRKIESKIEIQKERRRKYEDIEKRLNDSKDTQISTPDKDARSLMLTNNVSGVGYVIQAALSCIHQPSYTSRYIKHFHVETVK